MTQDSSSLSVASLHSDLDKKELFSRQISHFNLWYIYRTFSFELLDLSCTVCRHSWVIGRHASHILTFLTHVLTIITFLLLERTPLERCCVHNMSPFVSSSGLSPGSREAKVQRAKVCINCTEPSVAMSSCWSLPVGRYLSDTLCKGLTWSSWGELRAIWPKSHRRLLVTSYSWNSWK